MNPPGPETLPPHLRPDRARFERFFEGLMSPSRWIDADLHGTEHLPDGPALLVGNHGPLGMDTPVLIHALYRQFDRIVRPLADRILFTNPLGRYFTSMTAAVEGEPEAAVTLLRAGEWVVVYPGGARETQRQSDERYTLSWEGRAGFARVAMRAGVPVVPVACIGNDDVFFQLASRAAVARTLPGRLVSSWLGEDYVSPVLFPIPRRRVRFQYFLGAPIMMEGSDTDDRALVSSNQLKVKHALEDLLTRGLEVRRGQRPGS